MLSGAKRSRNISRKTRFPWTYYILPVGGINRGMKAYGWRYLRARTEISAGEGRDIRGQKRRYPPAKLRNGPTDKVHIAHNSANGLYINKVYSFPVDNAVIQCIL